MDVILFFEYLEQFDFPGAGMFQYVTFRSAMAALLALLFRFLPASTSSDGCRRSRLGNHP